MPDRTLLMPLARLWAKTSGKGTEYMSGRLGLAKLVLLPVRETQADGHTHELFVTAPTDMRQQATPAAPAHQPSSAQPRRASPSRRGNGEATNKTRIDDDIIPF
jgi:hypothetical protein